MVPTSINVGSDVLLLVGKGQVHKRQRALMVEIEYDMDRRVFHNKSVTFLASRGSRVGWDFCRLAATAIITQNSSSDLS